MSLYFPNNYHNFSATELAKRRSDAGDALALQ